MDPSDTHLTYHECEYNRNTPKPKLTITVRSYTDFINSEVYNSSQLPLSRTVTRAAYRTSCGTPRTDEDSPHSFSPSAELTASNHETYQNSQAMKSTESLTSFSSNYSNASSDAQSNDMSAYSEYKEPLNVSLFPGLYNGKEVTMHTKYSNFSFSKAIMWRRFMPMVSEHFQMVIEKINDFPKDLEACVSAHCSDEVNRDIKLHNQGKLECKSTSEFMKLVIDRLQGFFDAHSIDAKYVHYRYTNEIGQPNVTLVYNNMPHMVGVYVEDNEFPQITSDDFFFRRLNSNTNPAAGLSDQNEALVRLSIDSVFRAFQYMALNELSYGFISTSKYTRFLSRDSENNRILYISPAIDHTNNSGSLSIATCMVAISTLAMMNKENDNRSTLPNLSSYASLTFFKKYSTAGLPTDASGSLPFSLSCPEQKPMVEALGDNKDSTNTQDEIADAKVSEAAIVGTFPVKPTSTNTSIMNGVLRVGPVIRTSVQEDDEGAEEDQDVSSISGLSNDEDVSNYSEVFEESSPISETEQPISSPGSSTSFTATSVDDGYVYLDAIPAVSPTSSPFDITRVFTPPPTTKQSDYNDVPSEGFGENVFYPLEACAVATPSVYNLSSRTIGYPGDVKWWKVVKAKRNIYMIKFRNNNSTTEGEIEITETDLRPESEFEYNRLERDESLKRSTHRTGASSSSSYDSHYARNFRYNSNNLTNRLTLNSRSVYPQSSNKNPTKYNPYLRSDDKPTSQKYGKGVSHCVAPIERNTRVIIANIKILDTSAQECDETLKEFENEAQMCEYFATRPQEFASCVPINYVYGSVLGFFMVLAVEKCGRPVVPKDLILASYDQEGNQIMELNQKVCQEMHRVLSDLHAMRILHHNISLENFTIDERYNIKDLRVPNVKLSNFAKCKLYLRLYRQASQEEHIQLDKLFCTVLDQARKGNILNMKD